MRSTIFRLSRLVLVPTTLALAACSSSDSQAPAGGGGSGAATCPSASCKQGNSVCLAIADNTGTGKTQLRMTQLVTTAPAALTTVFFEETVLNKNMRIPYDTCDIFGTGQFSWLLSWDDATGKATVGGGPTLASEQAAAAGTCFLKFHDDKSGFDAAPVTVDSKIGADGTFDVAVDDLVMPIFLDAIGASYVLLPLHKARVTNTPSGKITDDAGNPSSSGNCIGKYRAGALDPETSCFPKEDNYSFFEMGGELSGYITVAESDTVWVKDLQESLCALLAPTASLYKDADTHKCKVDANGNILLKGDWDSATNTAVPEGTGDSFRLAAQFAANAVHIKGTATKFDCSDAQ